MHRGWEPETPGTLRRSTMVADDSGAAGLVHIQPRCQGLTTDPLHPCCRCHPPTADLNSARHEKTFDPMARIEAVRWSAGECAEVARCEADLLRRGRINTSIRHKSCYMASIYNR